MLHCYYGIGQGRDVGQPMVVTMSHRKPNKWWVGEYAVFGDNSRQGRGW
ncbi:hypothetical protein [Dickeya oryzae]|nr:hypothetical protein [Dickeya oryzae]